MPRRNQQPAEVFPPATKELDREDPNAFPLLVAFDLDYTLWDLWIDTHITPPLKRKGDEVNKLTDRRGQTLEFYREVPALLNDLKRRRIHIAAASRTSAPELAREALGMLLVPSEDGQGKLKRSIELFNTVRVLALARCRMCSSEG
ncbi:magnesium-dependent phosphatase 1, partial [Tremellales sp. Uapishka_1]